VKYKLLLVLFLFAAAINMAQAYSPNSYASFVTTQYSTPSFNSYYGSSVGQYWPILNNPDECNDRQDLLLSVAPAGCQPAVVRSDLLAEQNVPVFCQINVLNANPLINVNEIRDISFTAQKYPKGISSGAVGFHPARAALRTTNTLLGDPLQNNIGYAVVILTKQPNETALPSNVVLNLSARVYYDSSNVFGVGTSEFALEEMSDADFATAKFKQSFWNGKYYVRLTDVDESGNSATVAIYNGDHQIGSVKVGKNQVSQKIYLPGSYCQASLQASFVNFEGARKKARIEVGDANGVDSFDAYEGTSFLNGKCIVQRIDIQNLSSNTGSVTVSCPSGKIVLSLLQQGEGAFGIFADGKGGFLPITRDGSMFVVDMGGSKGKYAIGDDNKLLVYVDKGFVPLANSNTKQNQAFLNQVEAGLKEYKLKVLADPSYKMEQISNQKESSDIAGNLTKAFDYYEKVVRDYPTEGEVSEVYGQQALEKAIDLAVNFGQNLKKIELMKEYIDKYPNTAQAQNYGNQLQNNFMVDSSKASNIIYLEDRYRTIRLVSIEEPRDKPEAEFSYGNNPSVVIKQGENITASAGYIKLISTAPDSATIYTDCADYARNRGSFTTSGITRVSSGNLALGQAISVCGQPLILRKVSMKQVARIKLTPNTRNTETETNLTIGIGIEKRAIKLTPEKAQEKIVNLNETIKKWESISKNLEKVVSGLKGACFATAAVLNIKNFFSGLSGEALARQKVMPYWVDKCKKEMSDTPGLSMDGCLFKHNSEIEQGVKAENDVVNNVNSKIDEIQKNYPCRTSSGIVDSKCTNTKEAAVAYAQFIKNNYGDKCINLPNGKKWMDTSENCVKVSEMLKDEEAIKSGVISYDELRAIQTNLESASASGFSADNKAYFDKVLSSSADRMNDDLKADKVYKQSQDSKNSGLPPLNNFISFGGANKMSAGMQIVSKNSVEGKIQFPNQAGMTLPSDSDYVSHIMTSKMSTGSGKDGVALDGGEYLLLLKKSAGDAEVYEITNAYKVNNIDKGVMFLNPEDAGYNAKANLGFIKGGTGIVSYNHPIQLSDQVVRYYETDPYKGLPAIVPFDVQHGWYAATKQTLPVGGGSGAFDSSGKVASFYLCNVMDNGIINFEQSDFGDDICQRFDMNTGMSLKQFGNLAEADTSKLVDKAIKAVQEAARQYSTGGTSVLIDSKNMKRGKPMANVPETNCANFMSPMECQIMFNVCDPVICPPSRCNLGGKYYVPDVIQSGIVGSVFLCLPNAKEGIVMPVCLSGVQAGIDGYVSILKTYRDCLDENVRTGQLLGLCDQMYSLYSCDFFWRQLAPLAKVMLPKLLESAAGQGTRGGGEYLTVQSAWQNTEKSINYFKDFYAINSFKALQYRSIDEAGGEVCKAYISGGIPTSFKSLTQPDSPVQFTAYFDSVRYSDVTIPATAQYKVFYHIFSGKDQGVAYRVYLKGAPQSSYYVANQVIQVATGFIAKGEYKTETKDFTAPEGYKELCVMINGEEKCGFKQVSTSFAVNYVSDTVVKNQIEQTNINSEQSCISGTTSLAAAANPNLQSMAQEAISPDIYRRGVIRVCATQNPGQGTDPTRYVRVGDCGSTNFGCWLDKNSVNNAITDNNIGLKNETLQDLAKLQSSNILNPNQVISQIDANATLTDFSGQLRGFEQTLGASQDVKINLDDISILLTKMNVLNKMLIWNNEKAKSLYLLGQIHGLIANILNRKSAVSGQTGGSGSSTAQAAGEDYPVYSAANNAGNINSVNFRFNRVNTIWEFALSTAQGSWSSVDNAAGYDLNENITKLIECLKQYNTESGETDGQICFDQSNPAISKTSNDVLSLGGEYSPAQESKILLNGKETGLYIQNNRVHLLVVPLKDSIVGSIDNNLKIKLLDSYKNDMEKAQKGLFDELNGATIGSYDAVKGETRIDTNFNSPLDTEGTKGVADTISGDVADNGVVEPSACSISSGGISESSDEFDWDFMNGLVFSNSDAKKNDCCICFYGTNRGDSEKFRNEECGAFFKGACNKGDSDFKCGVNATISLENAADVTDWITNNRCASPLHVNVEQHALECKSFVNVLGLCVKGFNGELIDARTDSCQTFRSVDKAVGYFRTLQKSLGEKGISIVAQGNRLNGNFGAPFCTLTSIINVDAESVTVTPGICRPVDEQCSPADGAAYPCMDNGQETTQRCCLKSISSFRDRGVFVKPGSQCSVPSRAKW